MGRTLCAQFPPGHSLVGCRVAGVRAGADRRLCRSGRHGQSVRGLPRVLRAWGSGGCPRGPAQEPFRSDGAATARNGADRSTRRADRVGPARGQRHAVQGTGHRNASHQQLPDDGGHHRGDRARGSTAHGEAARPRTLDRRRERQARQHRGRQVFFQRHPPGEGRERHGESRECQAGQGRDPESRTRARCRAKRRGERGGRQDTPGHGPGTADRAGRSATWSPYARSTETAGQAVGAAARAERPSKGWPCRTTAATATSGHRTATRAAR